MTQEFKCRFFEGKLFRKKKKSVKQDVKQDKEGEQEGKGSNPGWWLGCVAAPVSWTMFPWEGGKLQEFNSHTHRSRSMNALALRDGGWGPHIYYYSEGETAIGIMYNCNSCFSLAQSKEI